MKTITRVAREKAKSAEIRRVHVPTKIGLPPIEVLGRMVEFSGYTRHQLLQINHEDLTAVAIQAQADYQAMLDLANLTRNARNTFYEGLVAQNEEFVQNMTQKKELILEAQEEVRNPQQELEGVLRKRRSLTANDISNTTTDSSLTSDNSTTQIDEAENTTSSSSITATTTTTTTSSTTSTTTTTTTTAFEGVTEPWNEYDPPGM